MRKLELLLIVVLIAMLGYWQSRGVRSDLEWRVNGVRVSAELKEFEKALGQSTKGFGQEESVVFLLPTGRTVQRSESFENGRHRVIVSGNRLQRADGLEIAEGMSAAEVERLLGSPPERFSAKGTTAYSYDNVTVVFERATQRVHSVSVEWSP